MARHFAAAVLLALTACAADGDGGEAPAAPAEPADSPLAVMGVELDTDTAAVRALLGAPEAAEAAAPDSAGVARAEWRYPAASLRFAGGRLRELRCYGRDCRTGVGVGVGDSVPAITAQYPEAVRTRSAEHDHLRQPHDGAACGLTFELAAERVTSLRLGCDHD